MQVVYRALAALACAFALSLAMTAAAADQLDRFTIDRLAKFAGLTGKGQAVVAQLPGANKPEFANSAIYQAVLQDRKPAFLFVNTDPGVLNGITTVQIRRENVSWWQCDS